MSHDNLNETAPEKSIWGYKGVIAGALFFGLFLFGFFMAATSEPDYMPSQQVKRQQEALTQQKAQQATSTEATATTETDATKATADDKKTQQ
ncbi:hypothetical protein [Moraxella sp. ZY210820]|uniref:hypothetical protein n=1 Tax=unclassified Moraxella TaxID=2685852 RepID=UPI00272F9404|nr:hypothetical protein [Moraxella sp. ZY210820]WLF83856.1 hypothetical protein LU301_11525 [Moraxella sp. ZY210820]